MIFAHTTDRARRDQRAAIFDNRGVGPRRPGGGPDGGACCQSAASDCGNEEAGQKARSEFRTGLVAPRCSETKRKGKRGRERTKSDFEGGKYRFERSRWRNRGATRKRARERP